MSQKAKTENLEDEKSEAICIPLMVYPGGRDINRHLTISVKGKHRITTALTYDGLQKFRKFLINTYREMQESEVAIR
ncbi:MAG: hypothetical protein GY858_01445 [Candidatus Omnitrophica bacterium]|nr:hypothetical protein [Candidatus Omnitrophota bacterium]